MAGPPGTSLPEKGPLQEQSTSSVPPKDDSSGLARMRDRVKELEQLLKAAQGSSAVWKSKAEKAAEREKFLLDEIVKASEQMLCK